MSNKNEIQKNYSDDFIDTELYADYSINTKHTNKNQKNKNARHRVEELFDKKALLKKVVDWDNYLN